MPALDSPRSAVNMSPIPPVTWLQWTMAAATGIALSLLMWHALLLDSDLVGGDTWPYFIPQKLVLAESLARNELPLWHDLTGLGYPLLAESQAGVFYPSNQILYRILDVNLAYYASIVAHYAMAFVFAWRFARCQHVSHWASLLVALIFVYGWFPARISLEWSIIGGVWLPLTLWQTHEFLARPSRWRFAILTTCLATHLLAGHFTLAFINQLCLVCYTALQLVLRRGHDRPSIGAAAAVPAAIALSVIMSAAQLIPSMELKQISQREGAKTEFDPGYGHMPPVYLTQLVASWTWWHDRDIRDSGKMLHLPGSIDSATNAVEAHFYLGLIPLALAGLSLLRTTYRSVPPVAVRCWLILGLAGIVYATGWLLPITRHLPGFSYFMGPGRYTIVSTLAGAILSGIALDSLVRHQKIRFVAVLIIGVITWHDLQWSSHGVADAVEVPSILSHREESWVREYFRNQPPRTCRLLSSGPNVANIFDVSCVPQYLGIGPAVYFGEQFDLETQPDSDRFASPTQIARLQMLGVTHVLTTEPAGQFEAVLEPVNTQPDALLNRIWGRGGKPCYLYQLRKPGQRLESNPARALVDWRTLQSTSADISFEVTLSQSAQVDLKELMYPGWTAEIDGQVVQSVPGDQLARSVRMPEGTHELHWKFESSAVRHGAWISCLTLLGVWISTLLPVRPGKTDKQPSSMAHGLTSLRI
ncbi:MAG: hypothetical protein ABGZ35_29250 [Planctomycetaceae bacterium]